MNEQGTMSQRTLIQVGKIGSATMNTSSNESRETSSQILY